MPTDPNDTKKIKENTQATDDNVDSKKGLIETTEKLLKTLKLTNEEKIREIKYNSDLAAMQNDRVAQEGEFYKLLNLRLAMEKEARDVSKEQTKEYIAQKQAIEEHIRAQANMLGLTEEQTAAMLKQTKAFDENRAAINKFAKTADGVFSDLATKTAIFGDPNKGLLGAMTRFAAEARHSGQAAKIMGSSFLKHFNFTTLAAGVVENITESTIGMVKAFDDASASFAGATGTGDEFTGTMLEMRQEGNALGVTFENSSKALQSLAQSQVGFLHSSKEAQKEMATQVALMNRIGISTDTTAEIMNVFTMNMGESQQTAIQMTKALVSMGGVLGDSQKFLEDFGNSLQILAVYGDDSVNVFSNLAAAARAAGVEVSTLTNMASKFDTFAEGAETVGKLNALLGSQLSSTEMLLMTEDQRIETLIQQVQISGQSFTDMNKFQQMAIANAAGITDMNEAQRIFGMNMKDYKTYQKDMERQAKMQENFNKAIEATIPLQEKFSQFMAEFAIFVQPIADAVGFVLEGMTSLMASMSEGTKGFVGLVAAGTLLYTAFTGLGAAMPVLGAGAVGVAGGVTGLGAALAAGAPAMVAFGAASAGAAAGMAAFSVPLLGMGLIIAGVATSIGYMIAKFVELANVGPAGFLSMAGLASSLSEIKQTIGDDTSAISNALENLALIAAGTSAKAMKGGSVALTTELKEAVQAVMTTKIDISLKISDGTLKKVIEEAVVEVMSGSGKVQKQLISITNAV